MKITGIYLKNVGRITEINQKIDGNVICLVGPNGMGKTTVTQAIQFAFEGRFGSTKKPTSDYIRRSSEEEITQMEVRIDFREGGVDGYIHRKAYTSGGGSRKLSWPPRTFDTDKDKDVPLKAEKEVQALLTELFGVDRSAMNSAVFILQGEMRGMFGDDASRLKFYTKLMMKEWVRKVYDMAADYRRQVEGSCQDLAPVRDEAERAQQSAQEEFKECERALAKLKSWEVESTLLSRVSRAVSESQAAGEAHNRALTVLREVDTQEKQEHARCVDSWRERVVVLKEQLTTSETQLRDIVGKRADVEQHSRLVSVGKQLEELAAEHATHEETLKAGDPTDREKAAEDALRRAVVLRDNPGQIAALDARILTAEGKLAAAAETLDAAQTKHSDLRGQFRSITTDVENLQKLANVEVDSCCPMCGGDPSKDYVACRLKEQQQTLLKLREQGSIAAEAARESLSEFEALQKQTNALRAQRDPLVADLKRAESYDARPSVEEADAALGALRLEVSTFKTARARADLVNSKISALRKDNPGFISLAVHVASRDSAERSLKVITDATSQADLQQAITDVTGEVARLDVQIREGENIAVEVRDAKERVEDARKRVLEASAALESVGAAVSACPRLAALMSNGDSIVVSPHTIEEAEASIRAGQSEYDNTVGSVATARRVKVDADSRLIEIETRMAEQETRRTIASELNELKEAFSSGSAVLDYLDYQFGRVSLLAADYLAASNADFMVSASSTVPLAYDFLRVDRPGEVWLPQSSMSGGQQVRLAIATLKAIHHLLIPRVGLLSLDEPSTHIDAEGVEALATMLKQTGEEDGLQLIVVDHDPLMAAAATDTIRLGD